MRKSPIASKNIPQTGNAPGIFRMAPYALAFLLASCAAFQDEPERRLLPLATSGRVDPGYVQYLERQSMLGHASRLSKIVSGSSLNWKHPATQPSPEEILSKGNVWLHIYPQNLHSSTQNPPLIQLGDAGLWDILHKTGINGLYVAPTGSGGSLWDRERHFEPGTNEDIIQYIFPKTIGTEGDYSRLIRQAEEHKMLLGGDILPLAGGIGPDFFLSAQNVRDYPGLYCMIDIPETFWNLLPPSRNSDGEDWRITALTEEDVRRLAETKLIPEKILQDTLPYVPQSGWAVTDEVRGLDGNMRRWVYRYAYNYKRPLFNLYDPSQTARKILNGSLIYQVGILGNALAGYHTAPLIGLDVAGKQEPDITGTANYATSLTLAEDLARQSRSYGGWSWLQDELPLAFLHETMQNGPDLVKDSVSSPAAEHALLTGKSFLLNFMIDAALKENIDFRRLVHASSGPYGVDYTLPHLQYMSRLAEFKKEGLPETQLEQMRQISLDAAKGLDLLTPRGNWQHMEENEQNLDNSLAETILTETLAEVRRKAMPPAGREKEQAAFEQSVLYTTPTGLAALALDLSPNVPPNMETQLEIRRGHMLLQFFKAMQPGILMLGGQDLLGVLPLPFHILVRSSPQQAWNKRLAPMGSYALTSRAENIMLNSQGLPKAASIYGPLDIQAFDPGSAINELGELLYLRRELGVDKGTLIGRLNTKGTGTAAIVIRLPEGNTFASPDGSPSYVIAVSNFSRERSQETLDLNRLPDFAAITGIPSISLLYGDVGELRRQPGKISLNVPGWAKALILVEKVPSTIRTEESLPLNKNG